MTSALRAAPDPTEAAEYYFTYINQVGRGDILEILASQVPEALIHLEGISEEQSLHRYAPDKWSIREVLNHVNDTERVFGFRALWFARGFDSPLPSFDQETGVRGARADGCSWRRQVDEFRAIRAGTIALFQNLPDAGWLRRGVASGNTFTVRALAYIIAGHCTHHLNVVRQRYTL